jgi:DNA-binding NarL/FixJ family response regulator
VDDHPLVRAGLVQLVRQEADLEVCGETGRAHHALELVARTKPDLVVVDIRLPGRDGLELIKDIKAHHPEMPVLVISMHDETLYADRALRAGARGYLMKQEGGPNIMRAIRRVLEGQIYVNPAIATQLLESLVASPSRGRGEPLRRLTDRELQVFERIGQGKGTRKISDELHLSIKTVEAHRANIKRKLKIDDAIGLVRYAVKWAEAEPNHD